MEFCYTVEGTGSQAVILMHGWGCNHTTLASIERLLTGSFTVYNVDFPGFGDSSEPFFLTFGYGVSHERTGRDFDNSILEHLFRAELVGGGVGRYVLTVGRRRVGKDSDLDTDLLRRNIPIAELKREFGMFEGVPNDILLSAETEVRYEGYLKTSERERDKAKRMEEKPLPPDLDYEHIDGLRLEAREKLARIRPLNLGQAERISGVNPADIAVLMVYLTLKERK